MERISTDNYPQIAPNRAPISPEQLEKARSIVATVCETKPSSVKDRDTLKEAMAGLSSALAAIIAAGGEPDIYGEPNNILDLPDDVETFPEIGSDTPLVTGRLMAYSGDMSDHNVHLQADIITPDGATPSTVIDVPSVESKDLYPRHTTAADYRENVEKPTLYFPFNNDYGQEGDIEKYFAILQEMCREFLEKTDPQFDTFE